MQRPGAQVGTTANASPGLPGGETPVPVDEIDLLRAREYALLASLCANPPTAELLSRLTRLAGDASPLGRAHDALAGAARGATPDAVEREYFELFVGVGRGELLPYASYYLTGLLYERPLALLREDLDGLGIAQSAAKPEPEDHIATLCEIMAGLASQRFPADAATQRRFFERHVRPWASGFFADLENADAARFYRAVGGFGRVLVEIEAEAFAME